MPASPSILGRIVFSSDRKPYGRDPDFVWVMNADGGNATDLTNSFGMDVYPDLSPDGRSIVWIHYLMSENRTPLMIMGSDGSNQRELIKTAASGPPRWSPDGKRILYGAQDGVHTIRPDGTDDQLVVSASVFTGYWSAAWSPDGNALIVGSYAGGDDGVWVINLETHAKTHIFNQVAEDPTWSPTGDLIAFAGGPDRTLFTVRPDGSDLTALTELDRRLTTAPGTRVPPGRLTAAACSSPTAKRPNESRRSTGTARQATSSWTRTPGIVKAHSKNGPGCHSTDCVEAPARN